jgi:transposase
VYLELTVRRFRCPNPACPQSTFAEQFPGRLPAYARRTTRLTDVMRQVGFEASAESSRRILKWFRITASGDTVLRIVKRTSITNTDVPRVVGIDDWAIRKSQRYGSLIVDQETHRVLEVIQGRLAEDIQPWFQAHPSVEVVTRDRSRDYRKGLTRAAPQAQQVVDRWHLLLNLRQLAQRVAASTYRQLKKLPVPPELRPNQIISRRSAGEQQIKEASRQRRLDLYNEIQRLKQMGLSASQVMQHLRRNYYTIRFFYNATEFPERMAGHTPRSQLAPYWTYLETRFQAGCTDPQQLFQEIQAQGYPAGITAVSRWLKSRRLQAGDDPILVATSLPSTTTSAVIPSSHALSWLLVLAPDKLSETDTLMLNHILQDTVTRQFYELAQAFRVLIQERSADQFDTWLDTADQSSLKTVRSFAKGLREEYPFIRAALEYEWSNGQTEGQVTRLKFIKRQMYGRASFELLRLKVLYHSGST